MDRPGVWRPAIDLFTEGSAAPVGSVQVAPTVPHVPPPPIPAGSVAECAGCGLDFVLPEAVPAFGQMACEYCAELRALQLREPRQPLAVRDKATRPHLAGLVFMDLIMVLIVAVTVLRIWL